MTEAEWERCIELHSMFAFVRGKLSKRKLVLFAVACCRQCWQLFSPDPCRSTVNVAERFVDGKATEEELKRSIAASLEIVSYASGRFTHSALAALNTASCGLEPPQAIATDAADSVLDAVSVQRGLSWDRRREQMYPEQYTQIKLLHDVVGNPFRTENIDQNWLTSTVVALAQRAYQTRDFSLMPILADALQDADCDNAAILDHCRGSSPHVRGCWVVDLILGKA